LSPHPYPLMTMPQQGAQIPLLGRWHLDRRKAILREQCQQQACVPSIVLLFACLGLADLRWVTHSAFDPQLFHQPQKSLHRSGSLDPDQDLAGERGSRGRDISCLISPTRVRTSAYGSYLVLDGWQQSEARDKDGAHAVQEAMVAASLCIRAQLSQCSWLRRRRDHRQSRVTR
jgi:hypothetical protein